MLGVDYAWGRPGAAALHAAGVQFVMRYLSHDTSKNLSLSEAQSLLAAGIQIGANWETTADAMLRGHAGGVADAAEADRQAGACGLHGTPIYFSADWDATPGQQAAINAYLDGAASVIGHSRVGMYGGYWPLSRARAAGKASYWWGTVAWSGANWATAGFAPHIMQGRGVTIGGVSCDWDTALTGDVGLWPRPVPPPAPAPAPAPPVPPAPLPDPPVKLSADGRTSLAHVARQYGVDWLHLMLVTARCKAPGETWGPLQHHYLTVGRFEDPMPEGMVVFAGALGH